MRLKSKNKSYNKYVKPDCFKNMTGIDKAAGITLLLITAVIPLIVKYAEVPIGLDEYQYIAPIQISMDMFTYYKSIYILIGSGILFICLFAYMFSERLKSLINWRKLITDPLTVGFIVFLIAIVGSSIHSVYKYTVIHGISERYESVFILLSYLVIFAAAVLFTRGAYQCRFLLYGLLFSCFFIGLIGMFQFFKMDFFKTALAAKLVIGSSTSKRLSPSFQNLSYSTFHNPNSVGLYTALMLPITVIGAVYYNRGIVMRIAFIICAIMTLFTAIGCNSSGGLAGLFVAAFVLLIILIRLDYINCKRIRKRVILSIFGGIACLSAIVIFISPIRIRVYNMSMKLLERGTAANTKFFKDMNISSGTVDIITANGDIHFVSHPDGLTVSTGGASPLTPVSSEENPQNESVIKSFTVPGLADFKVEERKNMFKLGMNDVVFFFGIDEKNNIIPLTNKGDPIDLCKPVQTFGFNGMDMWGSGRGYIWARTLPLLNQRWITGSGPDSFIIEFPQDDIIGKIRTFGTPYIVVDKAHNLFLQTGVNTGVISMLALLFIFGWYIIANFVSIMKGMAQNEDKWIFAMRIAILAGVCGYAAASMSTDSTVAVSPVFWTVLGMGVAMKRR